MDDRDPSRANGGADPEADANETDDEPDEDEFDPFAGRSVDPPPEYEGDDRVHEGEE